MHDTANGVCHVVDLLEHHAAAMPVTASQEMPLQCQVVNKQTQNLAMAGIRHMAYTSAAASLTQAYVLRRQLCVTKVACTGMITCITSSRTLCKANIAAHNVKANSTTRCNPASSNTEAEHNSTA